MSIVNMFVYGALFVSTLIALGVAGVLVWSFVLLQKQRRMNKGDDADIARIREERDALKQRAEAARQKYEAEARRFEEKDKQVQQRMKELRGA